MNIEVKEIRVLHLELTPQEVEIVRAALFHASYGKCAETRWLSTDLHSARHMAELLLSKQPYSSLAASV